MTTWLTTNCVPAPAGTWAPAKTEEAAPEPGSQAPSSQAQGAGMDGNLPKYLEAKVMVLPYLTGLQGSES